MSQREISEIEVFRADRELEIDLRAYSDRVRFVLLARIGAAREAQPNAELRSRFTLPSIASLTGRSAAQLRREIDELDVHDAPERAMKLINDVCGVLGDTVAAYFATRTVSAQPTPSWELAAIPSWWAELRDQPFSTPLNALVAARALEARLRPLGGPRPSNTSTFDGPTPGDSGPSDEAEPTDEEWFARRRLARALLAAATSGSGHALEAQVMLERLCPVLLEHIMEFAERSARWVPVSHVLDRALRSDYAGNATNDIRRAATAFVLGERFLAKLRERPPRSAASLRLLRRVALDSPVDAAVEVARRMREIIDDHECAVRGRRYALWMLAELHSKHPDSRALGDQTEGALASAAGVDDLSDLVEMLRGHAGGYLHWPSGFEPLRRPTHWADPFDVDLRSQDGHLHWPLDPVTLEVLRRHLGATTEAELYEKPWDRVPRRLVPGARRLVIEMLICPGLVRTKSAADTIIQAGPVVTAAATRSVCAILREYLAGAPLPAYLVEGVLANLGYFRDDAALETLIDVAQAVDASPDIRAAAVTSLGNVLCQVTRREAQRRPKHWHRGLEALGTALQATHPVELAAAIHSVAGVGATEFAGQVLAIRSTFPETSSVAQLADWCLDSWDPAVRGRT